MFKESYIHEENREATFYIKTSKNKYYFLTSGLPYSNEMNNEKYIKDAVDIMNQIFN